MPSINGPARPLIDGIDVNPTLIDVNPTLIYVNPTLKYLETKNSLKLLVNQASSNGHVNNTLKDAPI